MTYADINKVFTAEANKYLERGYHFNTATMRGSQGEIAHIDLTDGAEVVRVLLRTFTEGWDKQGVELIAGRVLEKEHVSPDADENHADTIWNDRLEQISIQRYYEVNGYGDYKKFYGTAADAETVSKVRMRRYARRPDRRNKDMTNAKTIKIAVPFIRRKLGIKNVDKSRIEVFRTPDYRYIISYRGTGYQLNRKED